MVEKTTLVLPGKRLSVPKLFKRLVQVVLAVALTSGVALAFIAGSAMLIGKKGRSLQGFDVWLSFINRTDILATMILTAAVTVLFIYWQRTSERS